MRRTINIISHPAAGFITLACLLLALSCSDMISEHQQSQDDILPAGSIVLDEGQTFAYSLTADVNNNIVNATQMSFLDEDGSWTAPVPFEPECQRTLLPVISDGRVSGTGEKTVTARFTDDLGNEIECLDSIYFIERLTLPSDGTTIPNVDDDFGYSVAISGDGTRIICGVPKYNHQGTSYESDWGMISAYSWNGTSRQWDQASLSPSGLSAENLAGWAVALSTDGNTLVAGVPGYGIPASGINKRGMVCVFNFADSAWSQLDPALPDQDDFTSGDRIGRSVSVSAAGDRIAAGSDIARKVYLYEKNGTWSSPTAFPLAGESSIDDGYGAACALSGDGTVLAVGATNANITVPAPTGSATRTTGRIIVYRDEGSSWATYILESTSLSTDSRLGASLSVSSDGDVIVAGAPGENSNRGAVLVFRWNGSGYDMDQELSLGGSRENDDFGCSVSLTPDGLYLLTGATGRSSGRGSLALFSMDSVAGGFVLSDEYGAEDATSGDGLGQSCAISGSPEICVAGAVNDDYKGSAYIRRYYGF